MTIHDSTPRAKETMMSDETPAPEAKPIPPGEYAIVELFGHTTLVGRVEEVERFGAKMMALEPIFRGEMLSAVFHGGAAIYRITPCSAETAFARAPNDVWHLPASIRNIVPPALLPAPAPRSYNPPMEDEDAGELPF